MHEMTNKVVLEVTLLLTLFCVASVYSEVHIGVDAGDWIRYDYNYPITGTTPPFPISIPQWAKVEFLSVEETVVNVRVTLHMSTGSEYSDTVNWNVASMGGGIGTFLGMIIPANCEIGDLIYMTGYGNATITDETTGTYAGASRTVVYTSFYQSSNGYQYTYYWDKQTGVMVEATATASDANATVKATSTNMWQAQLFGLPIDPTIFYALVIAAIAALIVAIAAIFMIRRKKKPLEEVSLPKPTSMLISFSPFFLEPY